MNKIAFIISIIALAQFPGNVKKQLYEIELEIQDTKPTPGQLDTTMDVLKKRMIGFGSQTAVVTLNNDKRTIVIQSEKIDAEFARKWLLKPARLVFYECYTLADLGDSFYLINKKIEELSKIKNRPAVFDELEQRNIKEHFLASLINLAQPYNEGGGHRYPGYLGYLNIQDTSYLNKLFFLVKEYLPADCMLLYGPNRDNSKSKIKTVCLYALRNDDHKMRAYSCIKTVNRIYDFSGNPSIQIKFNEVGAKVWEAMTLVNRGKYIAMAFDDEVFSAPLVYDTIHGGDTQISGTFNDEEIDNVVKLISSGYLPLQLKIIGYREITPKPDK